jgi:hypothetical protein
MNVEPVSIDEREDDPLPATVNAGDGGTDQMVDETAVRRQKDVRAFQLHRGDSATRHRRAKGVDDRLNLG